ncbi:MAG: pyridoxamine 5'-phosphate oxidase family protein [Dehalococcoidia bacterium]
MRAAIREFLNSGKAASFLITLQASGRPYTTQVSAVADPDFSIRVRTNRQALKARHVRSNPTVSVLFVERKDGPQRNVLIQGDALLIDDPREVDDFFETIARRNGIKIDRDSPRMVDSQILQIRPAFLRAEGFDPRQFGRVTFERLS